MISNAITRGYFLSQLVNDRREINKFLVWVGEENGLSLVC